MRLNARPRVCASVRTSSVLAVPGRPVIRQWPPTNSAIITCSSTSSCPTITRRTWRIISAWTSRNRAMRPFNSSESNCGVTKVDMRSVPFPYLLALLRLGQFEQHLLRGPESRRGFESEQQLLPRLIRVVGAAIGLGQVVMRRRRIDGIRGEHGAVFADGAVDIVPGEPQIAQALVQVFVDRIDVVQPVERLGGITGPARFHQQRRQLFQR